MKAQRVRKMAGEIGPVVAARIEMKFVSDVAGAQQIVQSLSSRLEAVIILRAAIEIDFHARQVCGARDVQGIIAVPELAVRGRTEYIAQNLQTPGFLAIAHRNRRNPLHQRGAMGADRPKQLRVKKGHAQGAIAAHGNSPDAAGIPACDDAIRPFDPGHELLEEEILIAEAAVVRIHEETGITGGRDNDEIAKFVLLPEVFDQVESAGTHEHLLVVAESMKVVEHGIAAVRLLRIRRRQNHAVWDRAPEDAAAQDLAFA